MIKSVRSDHPSFKEIKFEKGFNVVLAERTKESTDRDSRNGLGKTTLIGIIHFCLGSSSKPNEGVRVKELENWTFILDLTLRGKDYTVYRNTADTSRIKIEGDFSDWPIKPEYDEKQKAYFMKVNKWNTLLGYLMFDLSIEIETKKYSPTFRSLISYFIRLGGGAFHDPFRHFAQQKEFDIQVNNTYLLGLNWEYASEIQIIKDNETILQDLKKAANEGLLTGFVGSLGELEAERVRLEEEIGRSEEQIRIFKVHPQYFDIQVEANKLTEQIHSITNQTVINQRILNKYRESVVEEQDISINKLKQIYDEAGLIFPETLLVKLDKISNFHKIVIENRKTYLQSEIGRISREIEKQQTQIETLSGKRAELFKILESHGALEEYSKIQNRVLSLRKYAEEIKNRIENLKRFEEGKSNLKIRREELLQKSRRDLKERKVQVENALRLFNGNSERLYSEPGVLSIDITDSGYKFKVDIKRSSSQGIGYMKIFCYDLMLIQLREKYTDMPGLLIHDSHIFDGVDERQIAKAMELVAEETNKRGFQYICTINSDIVPYRDFKETFKTEFDKFIRIKLTDATEDGGLLGFRF